MCLDGSPVAYYLQINSSSNDWVIYFEGGVSFLLNRISPLRLHLGGWCYNIEQCQQRASTTLGSSKTYPATLASLGVLSTSPADNPDFYSFNHVFLPCCIGYSLFF